MSLIQLLQTQSTLRAFGLGLALLVTSSCKPPNQVSNTEQSACTNNTTQTHDTWKLFNENAANEGGYLMIESRDGQNLRCSTFVEFVNHTFPLEVNLWTTLSCLGHINFDLGVIKKTHLRLTYRGGYERAVPVSLSVLSLHEEATEILNNPRKIGTLRSLLRSTILAKRNEMLTRPWEQLLEEKDRRGIRLASTIHTLAGEGGLSLMGFPQGSIDSCGTIDDYADADKTKKALICMQPAEIVVLAGRVTSPENLDFGNHLLEKARNQQLERGTALNEIDGELRTLLETWFGELRLFGKIWENEPAAYFMDCRTTPEASSCPDPQLAQATYQRLNDLFSESAMPIPVGTASASAPHIGPMTSRLVGSVAQQVAQLLPLWSALRDRVVLQPQAQLYLNANFGFTNTLDHFAASEPEGYYRLTLDTFFKEKQLISLSAFPGSIRLNLSQKGDLVGLAGRDDGAFLTFRGVIPLAAMRSINHIPARNRFAEFNLRDPKENDSQKDCTHPEGSPEL